MKTLWRADGLCPQATDEALRWLKLCGYSLTVRSVFITGARSCQFPPTVLPAPLWLCRVRGVDGSPFARSRDAMPHGLPAREAHLTSHSTTLKRGWPVRDKTQEARLRSSTAFGHIAAPL